MIKALLVISVLVKLTLCNIWDNLFTNLRSPQFNLAHEFTLTMKSGALEIIKINYSGIYNGIMLSLRDQETTPIVDVYFNFTTAIISADFSDKCFYTTIKGMDSLTAMFFLDSYDLFTYFRRDEVNNFYEYVLTNPLGNANDKNFLSEGSENFLSNLFTKDVDKSALLVFKVSMATRLLSLIDFKFQGSEADRFTTNVEFRGFTPEDFKPKHKCEEYKGLGKIDKQEKIDDEKTGTIDK
jgi:hypothetical protein